MLPNNKTAVSNPERWMSEEVRLTCNRDRHVKKRTVPRYNIQYFGDTPAGSPHMFNLTIEEDEPVVDLVIGPNGTIVGGVFELEGPLGISHVQRNGLTMSANMDTGCRRDFERRIYGGWLEGLTMKVL